MAAVSGAGALEVASWQGCLQVRPRAQAASPSRLALRLGLPLLLVFWLPSTDASRIFDAFGEVDALLPLDRGRPSTGEDHQKEERELTVFFDSLLEKGSAVDQSSQGAAGALQGALHSLHHEENAAQDGASKHLEHVGKPHDPANTTVGAHAERRSVKGCSDCEHSDSDHQTQPHNPSLLLLQRQEGQQEGPTRKYEQQLPDVQQPASQNSAPSPAPSPAPLQAATSSSLAGFTSTYWSSSTHWQKALQVLQQLGLRSSVNYAAQRTRLGDDLVLQALKSDESYKQVDGGGGSCFVDQAGYSVGCAGSCGCSWFSACFPKYSSASSGGHGQEVDVGLCSASTPISIFLSTVFFFCMIIMIVALRMCLQWQEEFEDPLKETASPKRLPGKGARMKVDATQRRRVSFTSSTKRASSSYSGEANGASPVSAAIAEAPSSPDASLSPP
mmetsp:Transcript_35261/g.75108  ORF Transcript_35261/g.75108 Transcript_35261/m.75108 type:complete len:444 (+) Transcript_35261:228-1559(+)